MQLLFWVLQITVWPALCYEIKYVETRRVQLLLEHNGELEDSSRLPNCGPAKRIFLNSHTYSRLQCSRAACDSVQEEALSQSTAFQLNQHCSFRHKCKNLNFPVPTSLRNLDTESLAVTIQYQCIDDQSSIINMCEKHKMNFTDTLHLTFNYHTKNSEDCVCWVNNGAFSLTIMDLRLKSRNKDMCSAAKLVINAHHYTCDPQSDSYGAIFGETIRDSMPLGAFISLVPKNTLPEMIWIQLTPEESSRIDCHGDRIASEKSTNMVMVTTKPVVTTTVVVDVVDTTENLHPIVTTTGKTDDTSMDDTKDQTYMPLIALSIIAIIFMSTTLILAIRICLIRRKTCIPSNLESKFANETVGNEETETTMSKRCPLATCSQPLLQHNSFQTRQISHPDRADVKETLHKDHGGLKSERVDKHPAGSSSDTEDSLLFDKIPKSDFHMKEITYVLVERPEPDGRDDPAEEQQNNSYAYHCQKTVT